MHAFVERGGSLAWKNKQALSYRPQLFRPHALYHFLAHAARLGERLSIRCTRSVYSSHHHVGGHIRHRSIALELPSVQNLVHRKYIWKEGLLRERVGNQINNGSKRPAYTLVRHTF